MNRLTRALTIFGKLAVATLVVGIANAQTNYSIMALDQLSPTAGFGVNRAYGLNDNGLIVGQAYNLSTNKNQAVYWDASTGIITSILGQTGIARSVNNSGVIVGETKRATLGNPNGFAFSWGIGDTSLTNLGTLGGLHSGAYDINDSGVITGWSKIDPNGYSPNIHRTHAFKYEDGVMTDLGTVSTPTGYSRGHGINDLNEVAGRASLINFENSDKHMANWDADGNISSNVTGVGSYSTAQDINNLGIIVGNAYDESAGFINFTDRAAVWDANGLHFLSGDTNDGFGGNGDYGRAWAINDSGVIVGNSFDNTVAEDSIAMVSFDGVNMFNLNNLVIDGGDWSVLSDAYSINELGQIVGYGIHDGVEKAFLLTPTAVPVPAAALLFGSALGLLGWMRRKAA